MSGTRPFVVPHWSVRHPQPAPAWRALRAACTPQNLVFAAALILGWAMLLGWSGPAGWQARLCGGDPSARACDLVQDAGGPAGVATGRSTS
ncbi:MAG: hypothetical protein PGN34_23600 [Methylobacterium frigidaeris]